MKTQKNEYTKLFNLFITIILLFNLVIFFRTNKLEKELSFIKSQIQPPRSLDIGEQAPNFSISDTKNDLIDLSSYEGKKILLVFSSPDCVACQIFWPNLAEFIEMNPNFPTIIITRGSEEKVLAMQQKYFSEIPVGINDELFEIYNVPGTPYLFLISEDQKVELNGFSNSLNEISNKYLSK